jgi:hypothetical protein
VSPSDGDSPVADVAILRLQSSLDLGLSRIEGQLGVIMQRMDQQDRRSDSHGQEISALEARMREVEQSKVSTEELERRARRQLGWTTVVVAVIGIIVGAGVTLLVT